MQSDILTEAEIEAIIEAEKQSEKSDFLKSFESALTSVNNYDFYSIEAVNIF